MQEYDKLFKQAIFYYLAIMVVLAGITTAYIKQAPERAAKLQGKEVK
jgi:hypothetical protein